MFNSTLEAAQADDKIVRLNMAERLGSRESKSHLLLFEIHEELLRNYPVLLGGGELLVAILGRFSS